MGVHRKQPSYEQLDECSWMLGFLRQFLAEKDPTCKSNMIEYLVELLQDAVDNGWQAAKGAHFVLVNRILDGHASWKNIDQIHKIREHYAKNPHYVSSDQKMGKNKVLRHVPCFKYNKKSGCNEQNDHLYKDMLLKHACQLCHQLTGKFESHPRKECPRGFQNSQNSSKNF